MNHTITINDFSPERTYINLKNNLNNILLEKAIRKAGSQGILAKLLKSKLNYPELRQSTISIWLRRKFLRLDFLTWLIQYTEFNVNLQNEIDQIKGEATSKPLRNVRFPILLTTELVTILANLYCDGFCSNLNSHSSGYVNKNKVLLSKFKDSITSVFGYTKLYERKSSSSGVTSIRIPSYLGRLLYNKFGLDKDNVPDLIKDCSEEIKGAYLRAVFDDEGTISKNYGQIRLKMKYSTYVQDIKQLTESLNIECSKVVREKINEKYMSGCYYFTISGQYNLKAFNDNIGFDHPQKSEKLKTAISMIKLRTYGYGAYKKVYNILRISGPKTSSQLAVILDRDKRTMHHHLSNLLKFKIVTFKKVWKVYSYEYLWIAKNDNRIDYRGKTKFS